MTFPINKAQQIVAKLTETMRSAWPDLYVMPIMFTAATQARAVPSMMQAVRNTSLEKSVMTILQREFQHADQSPSMFLGGVAEQVATFFGLRRKARFTAIASFNLDMVADEKDLAFAFWHAISHTLDAAAIRDNPKHRKNFTAGPMIPRRPALNMARTNLKADLFAALVAAHEGDIETAHTKIRDKATAALHAHIGARPELSPLPMGAEHLDFAHQTSEGKRSTAQMLALCRNLSDDILSAFDRAAIEAWFTFCAEAQTMAWLGYQPGEILSAAANTSDNPMIRNLAGDIAELLGLLPLRDFPVDRHYNPFMSMPANRKIHENICGHMIHDLTMSAIAAENADPIRAQAVAQCIDIIKGNGMGWCAHALFAVADLFDETFYPGITEDKLLQTLTARFKAMNQDTDWEDIQTFCHDILKLRSKGQEPVWESAHGDRSKTSASVIAKSIRHAMTLSPAHFGDALVQSAAKSVEGRAGIEERQRRFAAPTASITPAGDRKKPPFY